MSMLTPRNWRWVAEITAWNPATRAVTTLYYATSGFATKASDTPAHTHIDGRLKDPGSMDAQLASRQGLTGRARASFGDLVLENADGALDALLDYSFDGRQVIVRHENPGQESSTYPSNWTKRITATIDEVEVTPTEIRFRLRDPSLVAEVPLQPDKYRGDNVAPDGLEGDAELAGKPKPVCLGEVRNVPAVLVNKSKLIYQVAAGALAACSVYDNGIPLGTTLVSVDAQFGTSPTGSLPGPYGTIAYGNGTFVAVGLDGGSGGGGQISYSTDDGLTWTGATNPFGTGDVYGVRFAAGFFVAFGASKTLATSPDGIAWTSRTLPAGWGAGEAVYAAAYDPKRTTWLATGASGSAATSTDDGATWAAATIGFGVATYCAGNGFGTLLAGSTAAATVKVSDDGGSTWSTITPGSPYTALGSMSGGNNRFVMSDAASPANLYTSLDGRGWTRVGFGGVTVSGVRYAEGRFYAMGGYFVTYASDDGIRWDKAFESPNTSTYIWSIAGNGAGRLVVGGFQTNAYHAYLTAGTAATSSTDLLDDSAAPGPGDYRVWLDGGMFRLGSPPAGLVTADATEGATAADRTAAQLWKRVMNRAGIYSTTGYPQYTATCLTNLDAVQTAVLGFWTDQETTCAEVADQIARTVGAWWGASVSSGALWIEQLTAPNGAAFVAPADLVITEDRLLAPLRRVAVTDDTKGRPVWKHILRHSRAYVVQDRDALAAAVTDAQRAFVSQEYRSVEASDTGVLEAHLLAPQVALDTLFTTAADATAEAERLQRLWGQRRHRFEVVLNAFEVFRYSGSNLALPIFFQQPARTCCTLQVPRYGLDAGKAFRVIGFDLDAQRERLTLTLWGPEDTNGLTLAPSMAGTGTVA